MADTFDTQLHPEDLPGYDEYLERSGLYDEVPEYASEEDIEAALAAVYDRRDEADHEDFLDAEFFGESDADLLDLEFQNRFGF